LEEANLASINLTWLEILSGKEPIELLFGEVLMSDLMEEPLKLRKLRKELRIYGLIVMGRFFLDINVKLSFIPYRY